jgi:hypothetical protein
MPPGRERWAANDAATVAAAATSLADSASWGMPHAPEVRTASPERLAYEAYERGDHFFQIDVVVSVIQGHISIGMTMTRLYRPEPYDTIGAIEAQGWHLEHVSTSFVETGSSATKRVLANAGSTLVANHGSLVALYVFRRAERPS